MARRNIRISLSACAAAAGCAFTVAASAQSTDGVQAGLDRAIRLPLEIIWLQSEIQAGQWRSPALAHALQGCTKIGTPKEGCAVSVRSSWRYTFDASSGVRSAPIVISSLNIPNAPFAAGRLNVSGSGRIYLVTSDAPTSGPIRPPSGAILLAAGSTVQLIDAAYPSIQIEVKAPQDQPLFLGNLAESDVTKVLALLVKQPALVSASAASGLESGQVALLHRPPAAMPLGVPQEEPLPEPFLVASVDLNMLAGRLDVPLSDLAQVKADPLLEQAFTLLSGAIEKSQPLPEPFTVASVDFSALAGTLDMPVFDLARVEADPLLEQDFTLLSGAMEKSTPLPLSFAIVSVDFSALAGRLEMPTLHAAPVSMRLATAVPARIPATAAPDLAKMRAEIEAEIARERERMAQALPTRTTAKFRFGT